MLGQGNRLFKWYLSLVGCVLVAQFAVVIRPMPVKCLVACQAVGTSTGARFFAWLSTWCCCCGLVVNPQVNEAG